MSALTPTVDRQRRWASRRRYRLGVQWANNYSSRSRRPSLPAWYDTGNTLSKVLISAQCNTSRLQFSSYGDDWTLPTNVSMAMKS